MSRTKLHASARELESEQRRLAPLVDDTWAFIGDAADRFYDVLHGFPAIALAPSSGNAHTTSHSCMHTFDDSGTKIVDLTAYHERNWEPRSSLPFFRREIQRQWVGIGLHTHPNTVPITWTVISDGGATYGTYSRIRSLTSRGNLAHTYNSVSEFCADKARASIGKLALAGTTAEVIYRAHGVQTGLPGFDQLVTAWLHEVPRGYAAVSAVLPPLVLRALGAKHE